MDDRYFMLVAFDRANEAAATGNYPVGAALAIDGELIDSCHNDNRQQDTLTNHAELGLLQKTSTIIRKKVFDEGVKSIVLYTTLEPCLMCIGTAVISRVTRIVYACPDPHGGASKANTSRLPSWYARHWPSIEKGPLGRESCALLLRFLRSEPKDHQIRKLLPLFEALEEAHG